MANLFFPQLSTGATVQYPIKKTNTSRNVQNVLPDGSMILSADPDGWILSWELTYGELNSSDIGLIQTHFNNCKGPLHAFTFIDPTDNMLVSSEDLKSAAWLNQGGMAITKGVADPTGGTAAFTVINTSQATQSITQILSVPASYQYCLSLYAMCASQSAITLSRRGPSVSQTESISVGPAWSRLVSSGQLSDSGVGLTVGLTLSPGQQVQIYGIQLDAQNAPSRYRPTAQSGGVYPNAHWVADQLMISAQGVNQFSSTFSIETAILG
ncbi:MAG TPA: hypothetical protein VH325_09610 [Bryobacteraceae bacterium]|jgi:hypothetical protein|nr:hypothetical protein [Bryobacteraceae bacterium]